MTKVVFIHGNEELAREKVQEYFDPSWDTIPMPPLVEQVYTLIHDEAPDIVVYSLEEDPESVITLAKLIGMSNQLKDTRKLYLGLDETSKALLLEKMDDTEGVVMISYDLLIQEIGGRAEVPMPEIPEV